MASEWEKQNYQNYQGGSGQPGNGQQNYGYSDQQNYQGYPSQPPYMQTQIDPNNPATIPEPLRPIGMWGYFGYGLLFAIPCVGLILVIVFSFGGTSNINLRNYARSYFCGLIVFAILAVILMLVLPNYMDMLMRAAYSYRY